MLLRLVGGPPELLGSSPPLVPPVKLRPNPGNLEPGTCQADSGPVPATAIAGSVGGGVRACGACDDDDCAP
jgi:hypothetical protein